MLSRGERPASAAGLLASLPGVDDHAGEVVIAGGAEGFDSLPSSAALSTTKVIACAGAAVSASIMTADTIPTSELHPADMVPADLNIYVSLRGRSPR